MKKESAAWGEDRRRFYFPRLQTDDGIAFEQTCTIDVLGWSISNREKVSWRVDKDNSPLHNCTVLNRSAPSRSPLFFGSRRRSVLTGVTVPPRLSTYEFLVR